MLCTNNERLNTKYVPPMKSNPKICLTKDKDNVNSTYCSILLPTFKRAMMYDLMPNYTF